MVPNSQDQGVLGINHVIIYGRLTEQDQSFIQKMFTDVGVKKGLHCDSVKFKPNIDISR